MLITPYRVSCGEVAFQVGELEEALDAIKWGTDYLLNCHVEPTKFVAMFGNSEVWRPSPAFSETSAKDVSAWAYADKNILLVDAIKLGRLGVR